MMTRFLSLVTLSLALVVSACDGGEPLPTPETAVGASVVAPPCHDVTIGTELSELPPTASGHVIFNNKCAAACTNVAGGWTCILPGGTTVYCDACQ